MLETIHQFFIIGTWLAAGVLLFLFVRAVFTRIGMLFMHFGIHTFAEGWFYIAAKAMFSRDADVFLSFYKFRRTEITYYQLRDMLEQSSFATRKEGYSLLQKMNHIHYGPPGNGGVHHVEA